ncbi:hypothetical protein NQ318_001001 [Aromia moschata]|uniref:Uncharacterized protein n=1 Tax=Aromia moschata TaxID=1265417 RepID=A0AAV8ZFV9_9CUCU|nr:hypothetical protein NQ318_001001 [Aromia moschata]
MNNYIDSLWTGETQIMVSRFLENVLIAYFQEFAEKMKSSTLWTDYSIIKTVNIGKNSKTFSPEEIRTFIDEALDNQFP